LIKIKNNKNRCFVNNVLYVNTTSLRYVQYANVVLFYGHESSTLFYRLNYYCCIGITAQQDVQIKEC